MHDDSDYIAPIQGNTVRYISKDKYALVCKERDELKAENNRFQEHVASLTCQCADLDADKSNLEAENELLSQELEHTEKVYQMNRDWIGDAKERLGILEKKLALAREALEGAISQLNYVSDNSGVIKNLEDALKAINEERE